MTISMNICAQYIDAYNYGFGFGKYERGAQALCSGNYNDALGEFLEGVKYHPMNYEGIGICYELGFGVERDTDDALEAYQTGARLGSMECNAALQRIRQHGFYQESQKNAFIINLRASLQARYSSAGTGGGVNWGSPSSGSNSSGSSGRTCAGCHGSGKCTGCAGRGEYRGEGYYGTQMFDCPVCSGTGNCKVCYGKGVIR